MPHVFQIQFAMYHFENACAMTQISDANFNQTDKPDKTNS